MQHAPIKHLVVASAIHLECLQDFPSTEMTFEAWVSTSDYCHACELPWLGPLTTAQLSASIAQNSTFAQRVHLACSCNTKRPLAGRSGHDGQSCRIRQVIPCHQANVASACSPSQLHARMHALWWQAADRLSLCIVTVLMCKLICSSLQKDSSLLMHVVKGKGTPAASWALVVHRQWFHLRTHQCQSFPGAKNGSAGLMRLPAISRFVLSIQLLQGSC